MKPNEKNSGGRRPTVLADEQEEINRGAAGHELNIPAIFLERNRRHNLLLLAFQERKSPAHAHIPRNKERERKIEEEKNRGHITFSGCTRALPLVK
jgi:hypothetical protein